MSFFAAQFCRGLRNLVKENDSVKIKKMRNVMSGLGAMYASFFERIRALAPADAVPDQWAGTLIGDPVIDLRPGKVGVGSYTSSCVVSGLSPKFDELENAYSPVRCAVFFDRVIV
jgi:hypothetical protein